MINHIIQLNSKAYELNLRIIKSFLDLNKYSTNKNIFPRVILIEHYHEYTHYFINLFRQYNFADYIIIKENNLKYISNVLQNKREPLLLHGSTYKLMFELVRLDYKNINWVCWGKGSKINFRNYKSILFYPIKYYLYHKFKSIVTLLDGDKKTLSKHFHLKNIMTITYYSESDKETEEYRIMLKNKFHYPLLPKIYLGNSGHSVNDYIKLLDTLRQFAGTIEIHCMVSYGLDKYPEEASILKEKGRDIFGDLFFMDTQYLSYKEYLKYMNEASAYICLRPNQTGLGAIYTMLSLGKKVFINGDNYNHIKKMGFYANHINDIPIELKNRLSKEDVEHNSQLYKKISNNKESWIEYLLNL